MHTVLKMLNFTIILIKITQCQCLDRSFLQNWYTNFDEILHVAWACLPEGFSTIGTSSYSPVQKKGGHLASSKKQNKIEGLTK